MTDKIAWANPRAKNAFNLLILITVLSTGGNAVFAALFGGAFWWGLILSLAGVILILLLAEYCGAYDEKIVRDHDEPDSA